jgi:hypothetical protein
MLSFHIIEDILSICKGNQNKVCCGERGIEDIQIFRKYKIGRMLDVSTQAFPSPLWICGRVQHRSAPCTCAESSVPSRPCTPSAPRRCAHGSERQGRAVERATRPTPAAAGGGGPEAGGGRGGAKRPLIFPIRCEAPLRDL